MSKKNKAKGSAQPRSSLLASQRDAALAEAEAIATAATAGDEPRELTAYESQRIDGLTAQARSLATDAMEARVLEQIKTRSKADAAAVAKRAKEDARKTKKAAASRTSFGYGDVATGVRVKSNEHTYFPGSPANYMNDLVLASLRGQQVPGAEQAAERLAAHRKEMAADAVEADRRLRAGNRSWRDEYFVRQVRAGMGYSMRGSGRGNDSIVFEAQYRDLSTAAGAGGEWVPPLYLTELWVPFARPGRVFADSMTRKPLPPGTMSINIPVVSSGTTVAAQGTQNTNISDTDLQTEYDTFPVVTIAGAQVMSLQLIERSPIAVDDAVFGDLHLAAAQELDRQCVVGSNANGEITGLLNTVGVIDVAWNTGSGNTPIEGLYGVIANAKSQVASKRFLPASHTFMTPARWEWLEQQFDTQGRPLIVPEANGAFMLAQVAPDEPVAEGVVGGHLLSTKAFQDFNIPANLGTGANQDAIVVSRMSDNWLYESPIIARALPQTYGQQLSVLIQVYYYAAATFARYPLANSYITGTRLTPPVFNT